MAMNSFSRLKLFESNTMVLELVLVGMSIRLKFDMFHKIKHTSKEKFDSNCIELIENLDFLLIVGWMSEKVINEFH